MSDKKKYLGFPLLPYQREVLEKIVGMEPEELKPRFYPVGPPVSNPFPLEKLSELFKFDPELFKPRVSRTIMVSASDPNLAIQNFIDVKKIETQIQKIRAEHG